MLNDFLTSIGFSQITADFITQPEWLHIGSAFFLILVLIAVAYLLRLDLDPFIFRRYQPFVSNIERLTFWSLLAGILLWTYFTEWTPAGELTELNNKFIFGLGAAFLLILGRALNHFIVTEKNRWDFFDNLPFYLMVEFMVLVPLAYYYRLERNGLMPKEELGFAFACIFIAYFIIRWLLRRPTYIPKNRVNLFFGLFIAYMLLTLIFMPWRLAAIKNVIQWIAFGACYMVGLAYIPDRRRRDFIIITAVTTALISTLWGFWKYFDVPHNVFGQVGGVYPEDHHLAGQEYFYKTPSAGRYFLLAGFFANPNYYGEFLVLTIFVGLGLLFATNSLKLRIFLAIALAINIFEMAALYNRAGWLGGFTGLAFVLAGLAWARLNIFRRITKTGLAIGLAGLVLVLILVGTVFNARESDQTPLSGTPWERLKSMTDFAEDETFRNRLTMWRSSYMMIKDPEAFPQRLIFGGGFGFFEVNYLPYQTEVLETYNFDEWFHNVIPTFRAHNDHIQMLVEAGLIGTGFYVLMLVYFFIYGFRFLREEDDPARRFYAIGILAATASLLATAFFSFPLHKIQHGGLIFTVMGILMAEITERRQARMMAASGNISDADLQLSGKPKKRSKKSVKSKSAAPLKSRVRLKIHRGVFHKELYRRMTGRVHPLVAGILIIIVLALCTWGVYTQIINFKSQYFVVQGIAYVRAVDQSQTVEMKKERARTAADYFWRAYQLDPTNGRAEFFHGFALIKVNEYQAVVSGTEHLEEGQVLYPQSDTFFALAMGYEARRNLATEQVNQLRGLVASTRQSLESATDDSTREMYESQIAEYEENIATLEADAEFSRVKAIDSYMTAALYYPVKVEYYKDLIRLMEEEGGRDEEIIFWAERALIVDEWLLKKPPLRWRFARWLGRSWRNLALDEIEAGNAGVGEEYLLNAITAFDEGLEHSPGVYYNYYELGITNESLGDLLTELGETERAREFYSNARDRYLSVYQKYDRHLTVDPDFDLGFANLLLGGTYEKLGELQRALDYYREAFTMSLNIPGGEIHQTARERINALTGGALDELEAEAESGLTDSSEP